MPSHGGKRPTLISVFFRPTSDKIHHLIPHIMRHPSLAQSSPRLFLKPHARPSVRPVLCPYSGLSSPRTRSVSASPRPDGQDVPSPGRRLRSQRTPSASDRRRWVAVHFPHTNRKLGPCLRGVASGWLLSLLRCSACALFAYVLSPYLSERTPSPFPFVPKTRALFQLISNRQNEFF